MNKYRVTEKNGLYRIERRTFLFLWTPAIDAATRQITCQTYELAEQAIKDLQKPKDYWKVTKK